MQEALSSRRMLQLAPLLTPPRGRRRDAVTRLEPTTSDTEQDIMQIAKKRRQEEEAIAQTCGGSSQLTNQMLKATPAENSDDQQVADLGNRGDSRGDRRQ
jgi:hypothetical protein